MNKETGRQLSYNDTKVDLSVDNRELFFDWKYYPNFKVLNKQDLLKNMAVYLMLFLYISIICFVCVALISYTRSLTVGINHKQMFSDLRKLGADNKYIKNIIRKQLSKIFFYPTIVGSIITYCLSALLAYGNDGGVITDGEKISLIVNFIILIFINIMMYILYQVSRKKVNTIVVE